MNHVVDLQRRRGAAAPIPENDAVWGTAEKAPEILPLVWFAQIEPVLDAKDFVQGVLLEEGASVIYGESNAGKTFWATDLALHVAAGIPWAGRRVEQGGVIYCVLEGGIGFRNRVVAWKAEHDMADAQIPFVAIPSSLNLLDPEADAPSLVMTIQHVASQISVPVKLVVIDTLSRAMAGGNENAPDDMGALVNTMDAIRLATGAHVAFIHHSGKDAAKGARGHSLLRAAVDTEIEVVADEGSAAKTATVVKQREMKKGDVFAFSLAPVVLGNNRHGEPVTSCVVVHSDQPAGAGSDRRTRLSGDPRRALEVLNTLVATQGKSGHPGVPAGFSSVPDSWWRERFYEGSNPGVEQGTKQKAFKRAADQLINKHIVGMASNRVWVVHGPVEPRL